MDEHIRTISSKVPTLYLLNVGSQTNITSTQFVLSCNPVTGTKPSKQQPERSTIYDYKRRRLRSPGALKTYINTQPNRHLKAGDAVA